MNSSPRNIFPTAVKLLSKEGSYINATNKGEHTVRNNNLTACRLRKMKTSLLYKQQARSAPYKNTSGPGTGNNSCYTHLESNIGYGS